MRVEFWVFAAVVALSPAPAAALYVEDGCALSAAFYDDIVEKDRAKKVAMGSSTADEDKLAAALLANASPCRALAQAPGVRHAFLAYSSFYVVLDPDGREQRKGNWLALCAIANEQVSSEKPRNIVFIPLDAVGHTITFGRLTTNESNQFAGCGGPEPYWK